MATLGRSALWRRLDTTGTEHVLYDDSQGLRARGTIISADPVPYVCQFQLLTDETWATRMFEVETEGAGWRRRVRLERACCGRDPARLAHTYRQPTPPSPSRGTAFGPSSRRCRPG